MYLYYRTAARQYVLLSRTMRVKGNVVRVQGKVVRVEGKVVRLGATMITVRQEGERDNVLIYGRGNESLIVGETYQFSHCIVSCSFLYILFNIQFFCQTPV